MFTSKGFRVLPAGWNNVDATKALIEFSRTNAGPKLLGYMFTTWGVKKDALLDFLPLVEGLKLACTKCLLLDFFSVQPLCSRCLGGCFC
jgi:hypothetical protein